MAEKAMGLASVDGINGLTIGRLAEELGVSKSGLYAHFGSKLDLQLETIDSATKVFFSEVVESGIQGPPGVARVLRLADAYLSYVERRVFPGGCFFAELIPEVDAQEGPIRDALAAMVRTWEQVLEQSVKEAQERREIPSDLDHSLLVFQIQAALELGNYYFILFNDPRQIARARAAIRAALLGGVAEHLMHRAVHLKTVSRKANKWRRRTRNANTFWRGDGWLLWTRNGPGISMEGTARKLIGRRASRRADEAAEGPRWTNPRC